jgi:hypothetical protein
MLLLAKVIFGGFLLTKNEEQAVMKDRLPFVRLPLEHEELQLSAA